MATPNAETNNFVLKVWDSKANNGKGEFRPCYLAPDATSSVAGDVKLSDATDSTLNAATGMTAATPAAVNTVQKNANNKLDKTTSTAQTVASAVTFSNTITASNGVTVPSGKYFKGNLDGNAGSATKLNATKTFSVKIGDATAGTVSTDLTGNTVAITVPQVDASKVTYGTLPLSVLPQGALERIVTVADQTARYALTTSSVQLGDTVKQTDTGVMYIVIDESKLNSADGYMEYAAGTAVKATSADSATKLTTSRTVLTNLASTTAASFDGTANITPGISGTLPVNHGGTGATTLASGEALIGNGTGAITTRKIQNETTVGALDTYNTQLVTSNTLAYWDGRYSSTNTTSTNLKYFSGQPSFGGGALGIAYGGTGNTTGKAVSLSTSAGSAMQPVYFNSDGKPVACTVTNSGNYWGALPMIGTDGVLEIGKYIDFHASDTDTADYSARITATTSGLTLSGTTTGTFSGSLSGSSTSCTGNAATATALQNARNFSITGAVTASAKSFNGTANCVLETTLTDGTVSNSKLADNSVTSAKIVDGTIVAADLASNSITTVKITDLNVTTAKLAASAVTTVKIADKNVTEAKLADSSVTTAKIADKSVTAAKLADDCVTLAKLGSDVGTVVVSTTQPSDSNVKIWINA